MKSSPRLPERIDTLSIPAPRLQSVFSARPRRQIAKTQQIRNSKHAADTPVPYTGSRFGRLKPSRLGRHSMYQSHLSHFTSPPIAPGEMQAARPVVRWHCHLPLALERNDVQASLDIVFRLELAHGPLAQGSIVRAVTLPPGGTLSVLLAEHPARLIMDADIPAHHRCETVAAELTYVQHLRRALRRPGLPQPERLNLADDSLHVTGSPVSFRFLPPVLHGLLDRTEAASRMSEAAARTVRSALPRDDGPAAPPRLLRNTNSRRALTLFFYQAEKLQWARAELYQIDRVVEAPSGALAAEVEAEIDRNLIDLKLIDQAGRVTPAARSLFGWQRMFRLPTSHRWVKSCPIDYGLADMTSSGASLDLRTPPGCLTYRGGLS